jgi:hypothetical protein
MQASIGAESESLQVSKRRMRFELMPFIRVTRVNGADLGNHIDHALGRKIAFLTYLAIALVMDVVLTMQIPLKSDLLPTTETSLITHTEVSALKPIAHAIHPVPPGVGTQTSAGVSPPSAEPLVKCASLQYEYSLPLHTIPLP